MSTAPWHQPRNSTTITEWLDQPSPEILKDPTVIVHTKTVVYAGRRTGYRMLVSWENRNYRPPESDGPPVNK